MSARPSGPALWATDSTFTSGPTAGSPNKVKPSNGRIAEGWRPGDKPPAENLGWQLNLIGQWTAYLSDGALDGDHSIAGALDVTGEVSADVVTANSATVGGDAAIAGNATIAGNLTVTGAIKHGARTLHVGAAAFVADSAATSLSQLGYVTATSVAKLFAPIALPAGKRIKSVTVYYDRNGSGSVAPKLERMNPSTGTITAVWTGTTDSTGSGIESQTDAATNHTMLASDVYWLSVTLTASACRLYGAVIVYDEP